MRDAKRDAARRVRRGQDADDAEASIEMYRLELTELRRRVEGDDDF